MDWNRPGRFYGRDPHYFGYRVHYLPHYRRVRYWGIDYYFYNDVWYRWWRGYYVVCRPPYGIAFARNLYDLELDVIRFAYYNDVYRSYSTVNSNYSTILEQNKIIAENNALIAQQNATIAQQNATIAQQNAAAQQQETTVDMNTLKSLASYKLATQLGLIQSYAYADKQYFYDDGSSSAKTASTRPSSRPQAHSSRLCPTTMRTSPSPTATSTTRWTTPSSAWWSPTESPTSRCSARYRTIR